MDENNTPPAKPDAPAVELSNELSDQHKARLRKKAAEQVQTELTDAAAKAFLAEEVERLRMEAGISKKLLGGVNDELVNIRMDLGDDTGTADPFIQLDMPYGKKYYHNCSYEVPRHVANTLNEIMWRGKLSALNRDGKSVFRNRTYGSVIGEHGARHTGIKEMRVN